MSQEPVDADTEYLLLRSERVRRTMRMKRTGGGGEAASAAPPLPQEATSFLRPTATTTPTTRGTDSMQPSPAHDSGSGGGTPARPASSSGSGVGGGRTDQLAERISDEFLTCKICLQTYTSPKCLTCMHTFCEDCIERHAGAEASYKKYSDYREFACPLCRKRTQLPLGGARKLPDNFLLTSLHEIVKLQRPSKMPYCDVCRTVSRRTREAAAKCIDCGKLLCGSCVQQHRDTKITRNHSVFDVEVEKDVRCAAHDDEAVRFYCEPCERCVCVLCTFADEHRGHEISQFGEAALRYRASVEVLLRVCRERLAEYERRVESVGRCESVVRQAEDRVRRCAADMVSQIRASERQLLEELRNAYGADAMALVERRADMQATLDGLKSTCSLTELLLQGKGIELLLLKKDVAEKLASLSRDAVMGGVGGAAVGGGEPLLPPPLPVTVGKTVKFVPGIVDLGYLHDMDRPLLSRRRHRRALTSSFDYRSPTDDDFDGDYEFGGGTASAAADGNEVFKASTDNLRCAETQTTPEASSAGVRRGGTSARATTADAAAMTDLSVWANGGAGTRERSVQVNESELGTSPRRYGSAANGGIGTASHSQRDLATLTYSADETTGYSGALGRGGGANYESAADGVVTRRRRRVDRTRTTANIESVESTRPPGGGDAADLADGDGDAAVARRRGDATSRTARRFHLDSTRLRRYKSFEDDGQASALI